MNLNPEEVRSASIWEMLTKRETVDIESARDIYSKQFDFHSQDEALKIKKKDLQFINSFITKDLKSLMQQADCKDFIQLPPLLVLYAGATDESFGITIDEMGSFARTKVGIPDMFLHFHKDTHLITVTLCQRKVTLWPKYTMILETLYAMTSQYALSIEQFQLLYERTRAKVFKSKLMY